MRLNKYIASSGLTSRRKADDLIFAGKVKVNGKVVNQPWYDVDEKRDVVSVNGLQIKPRKRKYYLKLYKPRGYETRIGREGSLPGLLDIPGIEIPQGVFPVGRLDVNTEGLVLLTNDGEFSFVMTHPKFEIPRRYKVKIWRRIAESDLNRMVEGVEIGNKEMGKFDAIAPFRSMEKTSWYEIAIHEGKYHEIRRVFSVLGYRILRLIRVAFGEIYLEDMNRGEMRKFSSPDLRYVREIKKLFISQH